MKLILKITLLYLLLSLVVFIIGGLITFQVIKREIDREQERFLKEQLSYTERMILKKRPDKEFKRGKIHIIPLGVNYRETPIVFSDTLVMHSTLERVEPHMRLEVTKKIGDTYYYISLFDLIVEEDDIEEGVQEALIKMYLLLFALVLILSWMTSRWLLRPINNTLQKIKDFNIKDTVPLHFLASNTWEFRKLNQFLEEMTEKVRKDYHSLKEFTENASHEMQTPLSIAKGKLELLLESEHLVEEQVALVVSAQDSLGRLARLGKALSLLTKIENQEFNNERQVNFSQMVEKLLFDFKELIELKGITLQQNVQEDVMVYIDPTLGDILISNLLQNAVRHNYQDGNIQVTLNEKNLIICNTGSPLTTQPDRLFERFRKDDQSKNSLGLGLAIVKKICDVNGFILTYNYSVGTHKIKVSFSADQN